MGKTFIAKKLKKTSVEINSFGKVINQSYSESKDDEMKRKQEARALKLGMRR